MDKIFHHFHYEPDADFSKITCIDMHTGGEPLRIPISGIPEVPGNSVLEKRSFFKEHYDHLRTGIMFEPRGHADMYGAILSLPSTSEADFDVFFIHNEGYSTMCGHAIIALTKFVFETQFIRPKVENQITINVPAGTVKAEAVIQEGKVIESSFYNVPSYVFLKDKSIEIEGLGSIDFDLAYGGAFYAVVEAERLNLALNQSNFEQLISTGKKIKNAIMATYEIIHPVSEDLGFLYGTIFTGKPKNKDNHSRNVCIFADGELDRSATGSGVSARAALHYSRAELSINERITIESILGSTMDVEVVEIKDYHGYYAVIPKVSGTAYFSGRSEFWIDPKDPFKNGFIFR